MPTVILKRCGSYDAGEVRRAVHEALSGLLEKQDPSLAGKRILLKPNLAAARRPERCVTTHPEIVGAAVDFFKDRGCAVGVGDSPAGALRGVERVWENTGMRSVCEARGATLVNFEAAGWIERSIEGRTYRMSRALLDFDHVVSLPKLKTHVLTLITGAVKNMYGCVPGFGKSKLHLANPKPPSMSRVLVDVFCLAGPWLSLVDAVEAMEGNGPSSGQMRRLGFVAASRDAVALDAKLAELVGIDPMAVPTTGEAYRRGIVKDGPGGVEVTGASEADLRVRDFTVPANWHFFLVPDGIARLAARWFWVKPLVVHDRCTGCGECAAICGASAVSVEGGKARVSRDKCVSCLCCVEVCPTGAVEPQVSRLARLLT